jgi:hypothetical protein
MISRIKTHADLATHEKIKTPIIIVLTKFDAWHQLVDFPNYDNPWQYAKNYRTSIYNMNCVQEYSRVLRELLINLIPDLVGTAEANAEHVTYIAVSATGTAPEVGQPDKDGKRPLLYRPANIKPMWVEVPFFHAQTLTGKYCVPVITKS